MECASEVKTGSSKRAKRIATYERAMEEAHKAGIEKAKNVSIAWIQAYEPEPGGKVYPPSPTCGNARVVVKGHRSFQGYVLKSKANEWRKGCTGGVTHFGRFEVSEIDPDMPHSFAQSYDLNSAYASGYASKLREFDIPAYSESRLD